SDVARTLSRAYRQGQEVRDRARKMRTSALGAGRCDHYTLLRFLSCALMTAIRRRIALWLFPIALSLAQMGGLAHGISHVVADRAAGEMNDGAGKPRAASSDLCSLCASFAKVAHATSVGPVDTLAIVLATHDFDAPSAGFVARDPIVPR